MAPQSVWVMEISLKFCRSVKDPWGSLLVGFAYHFAILSGIQDAQEPKFAKIESVVQVLIQESSSDSKGGPLTTEIAEKLCSKHEYYQNVWNFAPDPNLTPSRPWRFCTINLVLRDLVLRDSVLLDLVRSTLNWGWEPRDVVTQDSVTPDLVTRDSELRDLVTRDSELRDLVTRDSELRDLVTRDS
ncbi:hypothetical protein TREMEDRAFT_65023 [Tremella mesenterica DSM 1558]|uniref:uncharacterized protein n=1 Tax=Tremella mesenterica (strain ATCC 24925 / CBS 8224 / DSM 1558 / NBRC 9311 / NRRL Y-6157 / RJB 2259-6 / UBC 559-6) TaxID=578456 RepID=UPI0003F48D5C|nr:uncharacterized protein TREMEDRAFT_65023 [Tremella mesenterica DSM 1558]EIW67154.1 hypothetical protein TREMEDRAFT_65023 [Tremella mesenterica DSM 1558]